MRRSVFLLLGILPRQQKSSAGCAQSVAVLEKTIATAEQAVAYWRTQLQDLLQGLSSFAK
jgi:hypothetical protein